MNLNTISLPCTKARPTNIHSPFHLTHSASSTPYPASRELSTANYLYISRERFGFMQNINKFVLIFPANIGKSKKPDIVW
jgi:hypothetical protein